MSIRLLLIIGAGGFLGRIACYLMQQGVTKILPVVFPYGTFLVNVSGCFLIGVFYALSERSETITPEWRSFLTTGICGGYTTFSTFSYESINLIRDGEFFYLSGYAAGSVILGFAATYFGTLTIKAF